MEKYIAGFVLIHQDSVLESIGMSYKIAEFFVLRRYRRKHVGLNAAILAFSKHLGLWEIPVIKSNQQGFKFWQSVLNKVMNDNCQVIESNNSHWKGPVFSFNFSA